MYCHGARVIDLGGGGSSAQESSLRSEGPQSEHHALGSGGGDVIEGISGAMESCDSPSTGIDHMPPDHNVDHTGVPAGMSASIHRTVTITHCH